MSSSMNPSISLTTTRTTRIICNKCFVAFDPPTPRTPLPVTSTGTLSSLTPKPPTTPRTCRPCSQRLTHDCAKTLLTHYENVLSDVDERLSQLRIHTVPGLSAAHVGNQCSLEAHMAKAPPQWKPWQRISWTIEAKKRRRWIKDLARKLEVAQSEVEYLEGVGKRYESERKQEVMEVWRKFDQMWPSDVEAGTRIDTDDTVDKGESKASDWQREERERAKEIRRRKKALGDEEVRRIFEQYEDLEFNC